MAFNLELTSVHSTIERHTKTHNFSGVGSQHTGDWKSSMQKGKTHKGIPKYFFSHL
jgi:hypothetical protein